MRHLESVSDPIFIYLSFSGACNDDWVRLCLGTEEIKIAPQAVTAVPIVMVRLDLDFMWQSVVLFFWGGAVNESLSTERHGLFQKNSNTLVSLQSA